MLHLPPDPCFRLATDLNSRRSALVQSPEFQRALKLNGQDYQVLETLGGQLALKKHLFLKFPVAALNMVKIGSVPVLRDALHCAGLLRMPLLINPIKPCPELAQAGAVPLVSPATIARLTLLDSEEERRRNLHQKWRNRLHHGAKQGLKVTRQSMPIKADHWLFQSDRRLSEQRGYKNWPVALTLAFCAANPGQAKLFQAFEGRDPIAGVLVLRHGAAATYHIAQSTERGKKLSAHNLLMWEIMNWLARQGVTQLDLGLVNSEDAGGLARFKLGTGADFHRLGGTWLFWSPLRRGLAPLAALDRKLMGI